MRDAHPHIHNRDHETLIIITTNMYYTRTLQCRSAATAPAAFGSTEVMLASSTALQKAVEPWPSLTCKVTVGNVMVVAVGPPRSAGSAVWFNLVQLGWLQWLHHAVEQG